MVVVKCLVFLVVLNFLWTFTRGDTEVSCVFMKNCILPCSFQPGNDVVIHWIQLPGNLPVHSYYHKQDQLAYQDQRFRGRTSLFKDQISGGNASLQLTGVEVQDEARYKCYTSTITGNKESFINIKVDAPVHKVNIEQVENRITCSSEGIYPEPELTWSTNPPSNVIQDKSKVQTEQQLYNISSSPILSDNVIDVDYSCTVSTRSNSKTTTLYKQTSIMGSNTETVPCAASKPPLTSITWRFNHSQIIVNYNGPNNYRVSEKWRPYVKNVSDTGSLILWDLSSKQNGIYTCELSNAEKTLITNTFLEFRQGSSNRSIIVGVIVGAVVILVLVSVSVIFYTKYKGKKKNKTQEETRNNQPLMDSDKPSEKTSIGPHSENGTS